MVAHTDGTILLYDKEREDGIFSPKEPTVVSSVNVNNTVGSQGDVWNPLDSIVVTMPPWHPASIASPSSGGKDKVPKNPVSHWRVSKKKVVGSSLRLYSVITARIFIIV